MTSPTFSMSGLSPSQIDLLHRTGLNEHLNNVPRCGAKQPRTILNACGLWYGGYAPCGDFSGTTQGGSGGPAALPYSPVGYNTLLHAGRCQFAGTDTTLWTEGLDLKPYDTGDYANMRFRAAVRRVVSYTIEVTGADWDAAKREISGGSWSTTLPTEFTGHGWVHVTSPSITVEDQELNDIAFGWYYAADWDKGTPSIVLTEDDPEDGPTFCPNDLTGLVDCTIYILHAVDRYDDGTWYDESTLTLSGGNAVNGLSITVGGTTYTARTSVSNPATEFLIAGTTKNTMANLRTLLASDTRIEVSASFSNTTLTIRSSTRTRYAVSGSTSGGRTFAWGVAYASRGEMVTSVSGLYGTDDTLELWDTNNGTKTHAAVLDLSGGSVWIDTDELFADSAPLFDQGTSSITFIHLGRQPFEDVGVSGWTPTGNYTTEVNLDNSLSWNTGPLDVYYIYYDEAACVALDPTFEPHPESDPEDCPTPSAPSTLFCGWPYWSPTRSAKTSGQSITGNGTVLAASPGTGMNHYWWGIFETPPECFLAGDRVNVETLLDIGYQGTPFFIEVLVLPDFDPEVDFSKGPEAYIAERLIGNKPMAFGFQSPIVRCNDRDAEGQIPLWIKLQGKAGAMQTIGVNETGDNYSQQWACEFIGGNNNAHQRCVATRLRKSVTRGPSSHIVTSSDGDWESIPHRWAVLVKSEHPSHYGTYGVHGYYPGEPYSASTGNGGVRLGHPGYVFSSAYGPGRDLSIPSQGIRLPWGCRFRIASIDVNWTPGGNY